MSDGDIRDRMEPDSAAELIMIRLLQVSIL